MDKTTTEGQNLLMIPVDSGKVKSRTEYLVPKALINGSAILGYVVGIEGSNLRTTKNSVNCCYPES